MKTAIFAMLAAGGVLLMAPHYSAQPPQKTAPKLGQGKVIETLDGPTLYTTYCAVCHGAMAKGDGPMAKLLTDKTPDLTRIAERHNGKFPRAQIDAIISGEANVPSHGTRDMPLWGPVFSEVSRDMDMGRVRVDNVSRYLESLQDK